MGGGGGEGIPPPGPGSHHSSILDSFSTFPPFCLHTLPLCCSPQASPESACVCLSVCLSVCTCVRVCVRVSQSRAAVGAELVGEAGSGLRSQDPVSSLMGVLARLPYAAAAASVHQLRPIIRRGPHLAWSGSAQLGPARPGPARPSRNCGGRLAAWKVSLSVQGWSKRSETFNLFFWHQHCTIVCSQ